MKTVEFYKNDQVLIASEVANFDPECSAFSKEKNGAIGIDCTAAVQIDFYAKNNKELLSVFLDPILARVNSDQGSWFEFDCAITFFKEEKSRDGKMLVKALVEMTSDFRYSE